MKFRSAGLSLIVQVVLVTVASLGILVSVCAQAQETRAEAKSAEQVYFERVLRPVEPDLHGRIERLDQYIALFRRELVNDTRLFAFRVEAQAMADNRVQLTGYVEFAETRDALGKFLSCLGFSPVDNQVQTLPSAALGEERFGFLKTTHSLSFDQPTGDREVVTDCLLAEPLYLLRETDNGFFLCHSAEGYVGYVDGQHILRVEASEFARYLSGPRVHLSRDHPVDDGARIPLGARLKLTGRRNDKIQAVLPGGDMILLPEDCCELCDGHVPRQLEQGLANAQRLLGTRYLWGGKTSSGIDCSGLVQTAFAGAGVHFPRDSNQQVYIGRLTGTRWHRAGIRRGDTLYFVGRHGKIRHTAVSLGNNRFLEAVRPVVRITSFDPHDEYYDAGRSAAFVFAKRLLD